MKTYHQHKRMESSSGEHMVHVKEDMGEHMKNEDEENDEEENNEENDEEENNEENDEEENNEENDEEENDEEENEGNDEVLAFKTFREKQTNILAVGVEIDFSCLVDSFVNALKKNDPKFIPLTTSDGINIIDTPNAAHLHLPPNVALVGVHYGSRAGGKPVGAYIWDKSDETLFRKYRSMHEQHEKDARVFIENFHVSNNNNLVVGECRIGQDRFFVFFRNVKNVATTLIKKELTRRNSEHYKRNYKCFSLGKRMDMPYRPYVHYFKGGKHEICFDPL
jgi:hypothetical protein